MVMQAPKDPKEYRTNESNRVVLQMMEGTTNVISKTNYQPHTIKWPKNAGECPLLISCFDKDGNELEYTRQVLSQGRTIESYSSDANAVSICLSRTDTDQNECKIELDRS
jgi:hypothetical protein